MNAVELLLLLLACITAPAVLKIRWKARELLFSAALLPVFVLTIAHTTQFLTVDEKAMISEPAYLSTSTLKQWSNAAYRTTDITVGPVVHLMRSFAELTDERLKQIAKAFHWLFGFIMLGAISIVLARFFVREEHLLFKVLFVSSALLLPVCAIAFAMCNYDLYSMLLGVLALLGTAAGFRSRNTRVLLMAVIIASFAAQEKLIATPVLWLAVCAYLAISRLKRDPFENLAARFAASVRATAIVLGTCAAVMVASYAIVIAVRGGLLPVEHYGCNPAKIILPFVSPFIVILRGAGGGQVLAFCEETAKQMPAFSLWVILGCSILCVVFFLAAIVALVVHPRVVRHLNEPVRYLRRNIHTVNYCLLVITLITGVLSTYLIQGYGAPAHPVAPGNYVPTVGFNGAVLHFGAHSGAGHFFRLFGWAYAVFYNAIPTALVLAALLAGPWLWFRRKPPSLSFELVFCISLLSPALFTIGQVPLSSRYFNLFILLMLIVTLIRYVPVFTLLTAGCRYGAAVLFLALLALELFPFRPSFLLFRPVWSRAALYEEACPTAGRLSPVGLGGGEEVMLAGEKIKKSIARKRCDTLFLYHNFYGAWLGAHQAISVLDMADRTTPLRYTSCDYYVIDRLSVVQNWLAFPNGIEPEFTIGARGFNHAWVFRGDRLAAGMFRFMR